MIQQTLKQFYLLFLVIQTIVQAQNLTDSDEIIFDYDNAFENPEETGPYLEGDIKEAADEFVNVLRNGIVSTSYRWPQAIVPYEIEGTYGTKELKIISHAINEYHTKTCVRFRKRTNEKDYVAITNKPSGCWASLGRMGGRQEVNLDSHRCFFNYGTSMHELMHVLGFYHEQNRFERDSYVKVIKENIKPDMLVNFGKLPHSAATAYGVPYDYASVMHYKSTSFSTNGKPTLEALQPSPDAAKMGQRFGFSKGDILKIKAMYRCQ